LLSTVEKYPPPYQLNDLNELTAIWKITALWAFSEAALGGILHAFKIPFRGVFIGGSAAVLISLIAFFSKEKGVILRSTIIVIIVKGMVSPYTPLTAYFAVFLQGILGEVLFFNRKFFKVPAFILAILALLFSSMQKIIILTILFGNTLWDSINQFGKVIISELFGQNNTIDLNYSYLILGTYLGIHILLGIIIGIFTARFPFKIVNVIHHEKVEIEAFYRSVKEAINKKKKKFWWKKISRLLFITLLAAMIILSYFHPQSGFSKAEEILIMIFRAIAIMLFWYFLAAPLLLKWLQKYLKKKQNQYSTEINRIVENFPHFKKLVAYCWKISSKQKGYRKIKSFLVRLVTFLLITDFDKLQSDKHP